MDTLEEALAKLKSLLPNFQAAYERLVASRAMVATNPALLAEYETLKSQADNLIGAVRWINNAVDTAVDWFSSTFGSFFGLSGIRGIAGLGQLGVVWVPLAYVVGVVGTLSTLTYAIYAYLKKAELYHAEYQSRAALVQQTGDTRILTEWQPDIGGWGATSLISDIAKLAVIGVAAYFIIPRLLKK